MMSFINTPVAYLIIPIWVISLMNSHVMILWHIILRVNNRCNPKHGDEVMKEIGF